MRAALYARFSTENQSAASVADQLVVCRRYAATLGAQVVREFSDDGISGTAMGNRPGVLNLLAFAAAGGCDVVIAEHTDRLSRAGSGGWKVYEDLEEMGVRYMTAMEGEVTDLHQGVSSMMSAIKIREVRLRTRRGLQGVVESGRSAGGVSYGYRTKRVYDGGGERIRGHLEVDEDEAEVVRRIFRDYAGGLSPKAIAHALNAEGVPGPRGGLWQPSTINGNPKRGNGVLHNELYRGVRVWGRQTFVKDRATGARRGRAAQDSPKRLEAPELRILTEEQWSAVQSRYAAVQQASEDLGRKVAQARPKRLLSGLVRCGACGGPMTLSGPDRRFMCATRREKGPTACDNRRTARCDDVEARVLAAVQRDLLHPAVIEEAMREYQRLKSAATRAGLRDRATRQREVEEVDRRLARLIDQLETGAPWSAIAARHGELTAKHEQLQALIAADDHVEDAVDLHPAAPAKWRQLVENLQATLEGGQTATHAQAREDFRKIVRQVVVIPLNGRGEYRLEVATDLAPVLQAQKNRPGEGAAFRSRVGAGTRFHPGPNSLITILAA
jgi:site-specific DNA recombinase